MLSSPNVHATESEEVKPTLKFASYKIPDLIESETSGKYIQVLQHINTTLNQPYEIQVVPIARTRALFKMNDVDSYFPVLSDYMPGNACRTENVLAKRIVAFTLKGQPLITDEKELEGKRVGVVHNFSYGNSILANPNIELIFADDDFTNARKLINNRIDVLIGSPVMVVGIFKQLNALERINYDEAAIIKNIESFFVFHDTPAGQKQCEQFSKAIQNMYRDGTMQRIFGLPYNVK